MFQVLNSILRRQPSVDPVQPIAADVNEPDLRGAVNAIGQNASTIGREAAEVRGLLEDTQKVSTQQARSLAELATQVVQVTQAQAAIQAGSSGSLEAVERARRAVQEVGTEVVGIVGKLNEVSQAADSITQIALHTRLVAFNATVEAKRAGEAGRGFAVVADAVKDLAAKVESSSQQITATVRALGHRIDALAREIQTSDDRLDRDGAFHAALKEVQRAVAGISASAKQSGGICSALNVQMASIEAEIGQSSRALDTAMARGDALLQVSERLIEQVAECGVETEDTPYIRAAIEGAERIGALLEDALKTSAISMSDLFDEDYRPIANTTPKQHTTRFVALTDRLFPQVQEGILTLSPKVVFCIAADRNGYIATHNRKYCQPQRGDLAWDTANSRYRRIFNDRTGLASARNQRPFLLQTYRRDMGGGRFVVMKEAAAPILVNGRQWGGLRLAFHF